MSEDNSVTQWIEALKSGDDEAARQLWQRYFQQLVGVARRRLGSAPRRMADEEDVAVSVFRCLCDGAARGKFEAVSDRDDLWRVLVTIASRKAIDQQRFAAQQKRGSGRVRGESVFRQSSEGEAVGGIGNLSRDEPTPEFLALLADEHQRLMDTLEDDSLRQTALARMEGFTNEEISEQLGVTRRSVERKLQRIRLIWAEELDD